ncbi:hypothetical protein D3C87_650870 [compost metagenome]
MRVITKVLSNLFGNQFPQAVVAQTPPSATQREVPLGSLINAMDRAKKAAEDAKQQAERDEYSKRIAIERVEVVRFLEAVKVSFTHDIKQGRRPHAVMIPEGNPFNTKGWHFDKILHSAEPLKHPHKEAFDDFFKWVKSQYLYVGLFRREDGRYLIQNWAAAPEDRIR